MQKAPQGCQLRRAKYFRVKEKPKSDGAHEAHKAHEAYKTHGNQIPQDYCMVTLARSPPQGVNTL